MTNISKLEYQSLMTELADASYADFKKNDISEALKENGFSETQRNSFIKNWTLINGGHQPDTKTGFSATLFKGNQSGSLADEYVVAIRGTVAFTGGGDIGADVGDMVLDGAAVDQIIDLYNYTKKITHNGVYSYARLEVVTGISDVIDIRAYAEKNGLLWLRGPGGGAVYNVVMETRNDGKALIPNGVKVSVTGHSLGGHLAAAFSRLFPELTANTTMVNGAGFATRDPLISNVNSLFKLLGGANRFDRDNILNLVGTKGPDIVADDNQNNLIQPGIKQHIFTENWKALNGNTIGHGAAQTTCSGSGLTFDIMLYQSSHLRCGDGWAGRYFSR